MTTDLTPIRVRGKVRAPEQRLLRQQKADYLRKHKLGLVKGAAQAKSNMKPKQFQLSRLEQLPTEVLELIFYHSANFDLPLVSRTLLVNLSNEHLQAQFIEPILNNLLEAVENVSDASLDSLQKLLNRRFLTWPIFLSWVRKELRTRSPVEDTNPESQIFREYLAQEDQDSPSNMALAMILHFAPSDGTALSRIRIPSRALTSPWSHDRLQFLSFWAGLLEQSQVVKTTQRDDIREALLDAVRTTTFEAFAVLVQLGSRLDDEVIECAVFEADGNKDMVTAITDEVCKQSGPFPSLTFAEPRPINGIDLNPLNPRLWQWADEEPQASDGRGAHLKQCLRILIDQEAGNKRDFEHNEQVPERT